VKLLSVLNLVKDRASTIPQLADEAMLFYAERVTLSAPIAAEAREPLKSLKGRLAVIPWERAAISDAIKETVKSSGLKMPQVAMPLRHLVTGRAQTPSIDAVLELLGRETVLARMTQGLEGK
jgi:glutamyl-tRNA synthetase